MRVTAQTRFAIIPEWVLFAPISPGAVRLYGVLARHADKEQHFSIVGREKLAEQMRCSTDTVDRALTELVGIGAVTIERRHHPDNPLHLLPSRYILVVAEPETAGQPIRKRAATRTAAHTRTRAPSRTDAAEERERVVGVRGSSGSSKSSHPNDIAAFERFFTTFPSARKGSRREVRRAWERAIRRAPPDLILAAAERYRDDPNREDAYTAGGARWLNRDGWEEGPLPAPVVRPGRADPPRPMSAALAELEIEKALGRD